jgi:hypothetical protein
MRERSSQNHLGKLVGPGGKKSETFPARFISYRISVTNEKYMVSRWRVKKKTGRRVSGSAS